MKLSRQDYLAHYGTLHKSGRWPWGSGGPEYPSTNPNKRNKEFLDYVNIMREKGMSETEIARGIGITTTELRAVRSIAKAQEKQANIDFAQRLRDKGHSNVAIGARMGLNESSVRSLLADGAKDKADVLQVVSQMLKEEVDAKGYIQVGSGVENHIGVSKERLGTALAMLKEEGYTVHTVQVDQLGTGQKTLVKVLTPPGTTYADAKANRDNIQLIGKWSENGGRSMLGLHPPLNVNPKRVSVRYKEDGGDTADGVIYVRPGIDDISLGSARYAQVRISVGGTHYLKGMAVYKDDLPPGVDLEFNTNKSSTGNKLDAMKALKDDPDNPFGAMVRQIVKVDGKGHETVTSAMNIVNDEGNWDDWSKNLSSQFASKQSPTLAKTQLAMTYERKKAEFDSIRALTNPSVRKKLLEAYADDVDASAVHLKAAALPRQRTQVLLPVNSLKDNEVYAPNFRHGEPVVLIRHPHGGTFEIPELINNIRNPEAVAIIGKQAKDAIGINSEVAKRLSGADYDGDAVLVIPNSNGLVKTAPALEGLRNFDPQRAYPAYDGMPPMSAHTKQTEMGVVSNLITDMTIRGASTAEIAQAVRHSMVVIDAEKHNLDYKQSAKDNGIAALKAKYQTPYQESGKAGASTLISRAKGDIRVPDHRPRSQAKGGPIDKTTGKKVFEDEPKSFINKDGDTVIKYRKSQKLAETDDAFTLSSGTAIEVIYATHSNKLKALADDARRESVNTKPIPTSSQMKKVYADEVKSLDAKLNLAYRNRPLERQAQIIANQAVNAKVTAAPHMDKADRKKVEAQALAEARARTGAEAQRIKFTDNEWAAIQAGAISPSKLTHLLNNSDLDRVKELATPRTPLVMTSIKQQRAVQMANSGYTQAEIADALGVSLSTLKSSLGKE